MAAAVAAKHQLGDNPVGGQTHFRKSTYFVERLGRLIHLGSVTAQQALLIGTIPARTPRDRPPLNPPTRFTVLGDSRVPTELSTPPPGWSLGGTGAIGLQPTPPLPASSSARSTRLFPVLVSRLSRPSEWLSAHPGWRIPTSQGTSGWD